MLDCQISNVNVARTYVGESLNKANCCRVSVRIQSEMESRWKADGVFMGKLDLSDEVTVGVEQMRIADDIVCYSTAISDCVKELNSLMALTSRKQTSAACLKTRLCSIQRSVHVIKACFGPMASHLLYQMQNTELRKNGCYYSVAITASGKPSHWNIALKLLKEEKEHDGDVSNTIIDNNMFDACENADQQSIELKTLV